jgi:thioredoxin 2
MQLVCTQCGTKNRVPDDRLDEGPKCGQCKAPLAPPEPQAVKGEILGKFIAGTELPVVVDFWAEWCGPCKMMAPAFADAARQRPRVRFVKVDTEESPQIGAKYNIRSIPTMALFKGGAEVARISGAMSSAQILSWIDQNVSKS